MEAHEDDKLRNLHHELFFASLICHVDPCSRILSMRATSDEGGSLPAAAGSSGGGLHGIFHPLRPQRAVGMGSTGVEVLGDYPPASRGKAGQHPTQVYGPSSLPLLDAFILSVCRGGGVDGRIRSWALDAAGVKTPCMIYNIKDNR